MSGQNYSKGDIMDKFLAMKLFRVMEATEAVEKNTTVGKDTKGEYKAVGEADVLNMVKPLFKKERLLIMPVEGDISEHVDKTIAYAKEGTRAITQLKVYFDIVDADTGESTRIVGFGNGADSQDKGSGKAFTYALKTALQKTFLMFSGEDTDSTHSDDITKASNTPQKNKPTITTHDTMPSDKISTNQLISLAKSKGIEESYLIEKYKREEGKTVTEVKFISADIKKKYFDGLSKLPNK